MVKRGPNFSRFVLNCNPSLGCSTDWSFEDAVNVNSECTRYQIKSLQIGNTKLGSQIPDRVDLRQPWWNVRDQGRSGACVGFATADGLLRWQYVQKEMMSKSELPSPRFIWMANKETDDLTRYPTSFIEPAGTSTKLALRVAQKYGCVTERMLPMEGKMSPLSSNVFFSIAAQFRISAYYNLGKYDNQLGLKGKDHWRAWIAHVGPVLTRLDVDTTWKNATANGGNLSSYDDSGLFGGHAVCLVGYTPEYFIVRNSWGQNWGDQGFAYASNEYTASAFTEAYGAVV
ncbi:MAG: C1 family peptidase [Bacteroidota bacterium]